MTGTHDDTPEVGPPPPYHRPIIPVLAGFAAGIALDAALVPPFAFWMVLAVGLVACCLWGLRRALRPWGNWVLAVMLLVPVGGAYHLLRFRQRPEGHLEKLPAREKVLYQVRGAISADPRLHLVDRPFRSAGDLLHRMWLVPVEVNALSSDGQSWRPVAGGLTVFAPARPREAGPGDVVQFAAALRGNRGATNPGQRDSALSYARRGSFGTASVDTPRAFKVVRASPWYDLPHAMEKLRAYVKRRLLWEARTPLHGLVAALVFGQRGRIDPGLERLLEDSGVLPVLAISGLHVGIFAALAWAVLLWSGLGVRKRLAALVGLVWLYVLFTGARVPALRAGLMLTLAAAAPLLNRRHDLVSALAGTALIVLLVSPTQLFTAGFQLSFVAVWAIVYLYDQLRRILWPWDDFLQRVQDPACRSTVSETWYYARHALLLSACVWAAEAPLLMWHFHRISVFAPLLYPLVSAMMVPILLLCFSLVLTAPIGGALTALLAGAANFMALSTQDLLQMASHLPGFVHFTPGPPLWWAALFYVAVSVWLVRQRAEGGRRVFVALVLVLGISYVIADAGLRSQETFELTVTDVGHGAAVVIRRPSGGTMLYDAGSSRTSAARSLSEMLYRKRVGVIDPLVISHRDYDHASFLPHLVPRFRIGRVLLPPTTRTTDFGRRLVDFLEHRGLQVVHFREGGRVESGRLRCRVLHPDRRYAWEPDVSNNDRSLVFRCRYGGWSFLLPGDIQELAMQRLLEERRGALKSDLVVLPHHGSATPVLREFLKACDPAVAVVSCSAGCDITGTRRICRELEIPLWTTAVDGAVTARVEGERLVVSGFSSGRRREFCTGLDDKGLRQDGTPDAAARLPEGPARE